MSTASAAFATKKSAKGYLLAGVDGRSNAARRFRELYRNIEEELGGELSEGRRALLARACGLCIWCEDQEAAMAQGAAFNPDTYATVTNTLRRLLADLGVRPPEPEEPDEPEPEEPEAKPTMRPLLGGPDIPLPGPLLPGKPPRVREMTDDELRKAMREKLREPT